MNRRRRLLQQLGAAGLLSAGGAMGFLQRALAAGNNPVPPGLHKLKGQVTVNGQPARQGQLILPGDTVVTGKDGEATYVIGQDAFLQRSGSTVSFGKSMADFMRVLNGRILSVFSKGERQVKFSTATIGIRGTACYIEESAGTPTYFCLCYGEAEVIPSAAPHEREIVKTSHHDHPLWISDDMKMPSMMVTAHIINHTDAELILLENLVGRWPPFYGQTEKRY
ncbi:MAG: hypothetical protein Q8M20_05400 [Rhodocyclaceae bacterium]|nr:hypothetical protein [Rhodocyclaceae bacterium]MDZ4214198.1 hypothetical protein [Rhodocyclaceae bacterium]